MWIKCSINDTSQDTDIWFNELYNLNLKFNNIKAKYEKYEDKLKSHVFMSYLNNTIHSEYPETSTSQIWNLNILRKRYVDSGIHN